MDLKQLSNFCKVAEAGSLTRAASALHLTQAALSRQLALLEAELQVSLFRRTGRGLQLTAAGTRLLEHAHLVLQQVAQIPRSVQGADKAAQGTFALGLPPSLARTIVVPLVEAFQAELPEAALRTVDGLSANLIELVAGGKLDCAVVYSVTPTDKVLLQPLADEAVYLVTGATPPGGRRKLGSSIALADIADLPLISAGAGNAVHVALEHALARIGKAPRVVHEIANLNAILDLVRRGHGSSVIPLSGIRPCLGDPELRLHRIRKPSVQCGLFTALAAPAHDPLSKAALELVRRITAEELRRFDLEVESAL
ncbi:MAG TPA: LysR substrate-binding domain-containing protein [Ramlibacter sp.]|nr:LysR substrate-binding domain-containing protein [Ramlibacter sp.]